MRSPGSLILRGRLDLHVQCLGGAPRPIRIAQHFARKENHVRLLGRQNRLRLRGLGDHSHCARRNPSLLANRLGKSTLIARTEQESSRPGTAPPLETSTKSTPSAFNFRPIQWSAPNPSRLLSNRSPKCAQTAATSAAKFADRAARPVSNANAVFKAAAILILARIGERRKKLVQQVAVRRMNLQNLKTRRQRAFARPAESPRQSRQSRQGQLPRHA